MNAGIDLNIIKRAKSLFYMNSDIGQFEEGDISRGILVTLFASLEVGLTDKSASRRQPGILEAGERLSRLARAFQYTSQRLNELLSRLSMIDWLTKHMMSGSKHDRRMWGVYAALAVKDFHSDVSSLMDSIAPVVIQINGAFRGKDAESLPGFADIEEGTKRSYRENLLPAIRSVIDDSGRWYSVVKLLRNIQIHREHMKIVFGDPEGGIRFQLYNAERNKVAVWDAVMDSDSGIVNFGLYAALVTAEILVLLENVAEEAAVHLNISFNGMRMSCRVGEYSFLYKNLEQLAGIA